MAAVVEQIASQVEPGRVHSSVRRCTALPVRQHRRATRQVGTAATLTALIGTGLCPDGAKVGRRRTWWEMPRELY